MKSEVSGEVAAAAGLADFTPGKTERFRAVLDAADQNI